MLLISVTLMVADHRYRYLDDIRAGLSVLIYPIQRLVDAPAAAWSWTTDHLSTQQTLLEENAQLRREHLVLKAQLQRFAALESENRRLRELLQSSRDLGMPMLVAELLAVDMDPFSRRIVLNKGGREGVFVGQPLLDAKGIVGQVLQVSPYTSTAILITDPAHAIPVHVNRNGLRAIALGSGAAGSGLELPNLPNNVDIVKGDLLISSGLDGRFPPDYPVGRVVSIEVDPTKPFARILAEPAAELERSHEVLLIGARSGANIPASPAPSPAATGGN